MGVGSMEKEIKKLKSSRLRYRIALICSLAFLLAASLVIFRNWDYISYKFFISGYYIHTDALDRMYKNNVGLEPGGDYYKYFDNLAIALISEKLQLEANDPYTYQYNPNQYESYQVWREEKAVGTHYTMLTSDTVYLFFANFTQDSLRLLKDGMAEISGYKNLVLDLRNNGGGDIDIMLDVADFFIDKDNIISIEKTRHRERNFMSKKPVSLEFEKIIILQNRSTASASEMLIQSLKENLENVTTIGESSYGKGVGQTMINLLRGFYAKATTLEFLSPEKKESINNIGIVPDILYIEEDILDYIKANLLQ
jgi:hypothetical protein